MQNIDTPGSFILAVLIFQLIPGPGTLTILRATASHGIKAGFASVAGTLLGGMLCMLAAASGLEAVFRGAPVATQALKWGGAIYLAWMGWRLMATQRQAAAAGADAAPTLARQMQQSLAISLTNPKVLLFYFALLPLYFQAPFTPASVATMLGCVTGVSLVYQSGLVLLGSGVASRLKTLPSARRVLQQLAGVAFIGFAVKLLAF